MPEAMTEEQTREYLREVAQQQGLPEPTDDMVKRVHGIASLDCNRTTLAVLCWDAQEAARTHRARADAAEAKLREVEKAYVREAEKMHTYVQEFSVGLAGDQVFDLVIEDARRLRATVAEMEGEKRDLIEERDTFALDLAKRLIRSGEILADDSSAADANPRRRVRKAVDPDKLVIGDVLELLRFRAWMANPTPLLDRQLNVERAAPRPGEEGRDG